MRGHIVKRRSRYYAVVYEGTDPATGKGQHRWYPGGQKRREAEKVLADLVKRQHDGDYRAPDRSELGTRVMAEAVFWRAIDAPVS